MSLIKWVVGLVLAFCVAYAIGINSLILYTGWLSARGHTETRVLSDLRQLACSVCYFTDVSGRQPPVEMGQLLKFSEQIKAGNVLFGGEGPRVDPNGQTFYDVWDNPVRLVVVSPHHYKFVSSGHNGIDEAGKGDDIVYEFDPWELASRWDANTARD